MLCVYIVGVWWLRDLVASTTSQNCTSLDMWLVNSTKFTSHWVICIVFRCLGVITDYLRVGLTALSERLPVRWAMRTGTLLMSLRVSSSSSAPQTGPWRIRLRPVSAAVMARRRCCRNVLLEPGDCPHLRSDHLTQTRTWTQQGCNTKVISSWGVCVSNL